MSEILKQDEELGAYGLPIGQPIKLADLPPLEPFGKSRVAMFRAIYEHLSSFQSDTGQHCNHDWLSTVTYEHTRVGLQYRGGFYTYQCQNCGQTRIVDSSD